MGYGCLGDRPPDDKLLPDLQTLVYTRTNPSVRSFRQAISISTSAAGCSGSIAGSTRKNIVPTRFDPLREIDQDIRQVWFAGVHADVGGGYPEDQSGLSKFPLSWMIAQAEAAGLRIDNSMVDHLGWGLPRPGSSHRYVAPECDRAVACSLTGAWWILDSCRSRRNGRNGRIANACSASICRRPNPGRSRTEPSIHRSVIDRMDKVASYRPVNLPASYSIEEMPPAPTSRSRKRACQSAIGCTRCICAAWRLPIQSGETSQTSRRMTRGISGHSGCGCSHRR